MKVAKLTSEEKDKLQGIEFILDNYFNPIQDANNDWIISVEEIEQCSIDWVKELPLIKYKPKKTEV